MRAKEIKRLHEQIRGYCEKANVAYKARANKHRKHLEFSLGDLVWLHLRNERFLPRRKNKLMARGFEIIERV